MDLKTFIKENKLTYKAGDRNINIVTLCGYALYIDASVEDCKNAIPKKDSSAELNQEIERIYTFAKSKNYDKFWETEAAQRQYIYPVLQK